MQGIDLHTHSNISDGALSPEALVEKAAHLGVHTLALTDHDSMDGVQRAIDASTEHDIKIITGVEISSQWSRPSTNKKYGVHIVALNMQHVECLEVVLCTQKRVRAERAQLICEKLEKVLKHDFYSEVLSRVDGQADHITRNHIAQALLENRVVNRLQQAFDRFLKEGKPAYVGLNWIDLAQTIQTIHEAKGIAILAHPTRYGLSATNIRYLMALFHQLGGDAVELPPRTETASTRQMIDRLITQYGFDVSIGSDFHGDHMPWAKLGQTPVLKDGQVGVWERFN
ncbi:PHP domain-containing protein [Acinetobacter rathckeae]|uniref:PHP domain-containing protein n=1 Tax=Acinetobacter rathckeae TaxID=2605272 RepID=UPI0018A25C96|nr:PHP domain-containing protein [Acinetobacter rathckeae]MBF7689048.1 PHP domain-containing protein [Acinetobacter rathckeae]MBF7696568.1 PHP domain-containing protein [Acinetobacter rathckeae]